MTRSATILVADPEESVRSFALLVLSSAGHTVLLAASVAEAAKAAAASPLKVNVLMTAAVLPDGDADAVAAAVRRLHPEARVLRAAEGGGGAVLPKPFDAAQLTAAVDSLLVQG